MVNSDINDINSQISDKMLPDFTADVLSQQDYYPFGMVQPDRDSSINDYRYGFNGQEKSDEISGKGNSYTALYWEYDPRIARRWNVDPRPTKGLSSYLTFSNNPVTFNDVKGDTIGVVYNIGYLPAYAYYKKDNCITERQTNLWI